MHNQAKITHTQTLPGNFCLIDLALEQAEPGEIVLFPELNLRLASLPNNSGRQRRLLCLNNLKLSLEKNHHIVLESLPAEPVDVIIGNNNGIAAAIGLAKINKAHQPLTLLASDAEFPFSPQPSKTLLPSMPDGVIAASPLLDDWGVPSRLASLKSMPGCYQGEVLALLANYVSNKKPKDLSICLAGNQNFINNSQRLKNHTLHTVLVS